MLFCVVEFSEKVVEHLPRSASQFSASCFLCFDEKYFPIHCKSLPRVSLHNQHPLIPTCSTTSKASTIHQLPNRSPCCYNRKRSFPTADRRQCNEWTMVRLYINHKVLDSTSVAQAQQHNPKELGSSCPGWQILPIRGQKWERVKRKTACPPLEF